MYKPKWYRDGEVLVIHANTCGVNKDGHEQYTVDPATGVRSDSAINDELAVACESVAANQFDGEGISYYPENLALDHDIFVPKYYDRRPNDLIHQFQKDNQDYRLSTIGELIESGDLYFRPGHGSPSSDQRTGNVPYIKVSDLRAGAVNINPSNLVPLPLAEKFWKSHLSGLQPYDLISPMRTSKNIGEFCVLMPGQEQIVVTKEVMILRTPPKSVMSQFYLMWALSLEAVHKQWERIIFMQTNREDVGDRLLEIILPVPKTQEIMVSVANPFRKYYEQLEKNRSDFATSISMSEFKHHIHINA